MSARLEEIRLELDTIDRQMMALFEKRMAISREVAREKKRMGAPVLDASREALVIEKRLSWLSDEDIAGEGEAFVQALMTLSKSIQARTLENEA